MTEETEALAKQLVAKYIEDGLDPNLYLRGAIEEGYVNYWDYIQVDTLMTLQKPRTNHKDEFIFIAYHQVTELYFKLCLWELEQIGDEYEKGSTEKLEMRLERIVTYFDALIQSFNIMINGMEKEQFLQFRNALAPASGFQSAQYRLIEMACTSLENLVDKEIREEYRSKGLDEQFQKLYWRKGAVDMHTGAKTFTLLQFEERYNKEFWEWANRWEKRNLFHVVKSIETLTDSQRAALRKVDHKVNVEWPKVHVRVAGKYMGEEGKTDTTKAQGTGGTNWAKYLPPKFQLRVFFPTLWTDEELTNWGGVFQSVQS